MTEPRPTPAKETQTEAVGLSSLRASVGDNGHRPHGKWEPHRRAEPTSGLRRSHFNSNRPRPVTELDGHRESPYGTGAGVFLCTLTTDIDTEPLGYDLKEGKMSPSTSTPARTMLEQALPVLGLSRVVAAERRTRDPVYFAHRWFARRPPGLLRGLLLAAALPADTDEQQFWNEYVKGDSEQLKGLTVYDPFHGGGTTLIEAGRLSAHVAGREIDPIATKLVRHQLQRLDLEKFDIAAAELLNFLTAKFARLYPSSDVERQPLHYFSVAEVTCPRCTSKGLLYRNLVIARGAQRSGSVARSAHTVVFCPKCLKPKALPLSAEHLVCCGKRNEIKKGTYTGFRYTCEACNVRLSHGDLATGKAPRVLIAVEETNTSGKRVIREPVDAEYKSERQAHEYIRRNKKNLRLPSGNVQDDERDSRPGSFGIEAFADMFTSRQLAVFGSAFMWIDRSDHCAQVRDALRLAVSNALTSNNRLCGYARDYGRLSALFSVRGYSLPALAVELNPLHPTAGRGTLARTLQRVRSSMTTKIRRNGWNTQTKYVQPFDQLHRFDAEAVVTSGSALESMPSDLGHGYDTADLVVTDPPYFDYIAYDRLSAFYRAWLDEPSVMGAPLLPHPRDPTNSFGLGLGQALRQSAALLSSTGLLAFTYHSTNHKAWAALGIALDEAKLRVTGLWPILADPHMGHHGIPGSCQYDLVIVTRPLSQAQPADVPWGQTGGRMWLASTGLTLAGPDIASALLAYDVCSTRWGTTCDTVKA